MMAIQCIIMHTRSFPVLNTDSRNIFTGIVGMNPTQPYLKSKMIKFIINKISHYRNPISSIKSTESLLTLTTHEKLSFVFEHTWKEKRM